MRELTKSVVSSSWALSLFGAQQLVGLLSNGRQCGSLAARANSLDAVTGAAKSNLSNRLQHFYELSDDAQRGIVDLAGAALRFDASGLLKPSIDIANPFVEGLATVVPRRNWLIDWQELRNKIDIYDLVRNVERRLNVSDGAPIAELVDRAYALGDFRALWAVEGLGHHYAQQALKQTDHPRNLLSDPASLGLPDKSLTMLNAGLGLAFAESLLRESHLENDTFHFKEIVRSFAELCKHNATGGYVGCALESFGLVGGMLIPRFGVLLDRLYDSNDDANLFAYYWHGYGRANYFLSQRTVRSFDWASLGQLSSNDIGKQNILAGFAWAITLANTRSLLVMNEIVSQISEHHGAIDRHAFANGALSSVVVRLATTPDTNLKDLCRHIVNLEPDSSRTQRNCSEAQCIEAITAWLTDLRSAQRVEDVFRYGGVT